MQALFACACRMRSSPGLVSSVYSLARVCVANRLAYLIQPYPQASCAAGVLALAGQLVLLGD